MAKMYFRPAGKSCEFGCYSERGLMSYLMFVCLPKPKKLSKFLEQLQFPEGCENPFNEIQEPLENSILFSELDLGKGDGFGCPDGAIYVGYPKPMMLFIETKLNESYKQSCQTKDKNKYNSTIQGQLELRWRLSHLHYKESHKIYKNNKYIVETLEFKKVYKGKDKFYAHPKRQVPKNHCSWRRLNIEPGAEDGIEKFLEKLALCKERVYFCAITDDEKNPFDRDEELTNADKSSMMPRCVGMDWEESKHQFCWMSAKDLVTFTEEEQ